MIDKLQRLSELSRETTGAGFEIRHLDTGKMKIKFTAKELAVAVTRDGPEYNIKDFGIMIDESIKAILERRRPATDFQARKPFTLFKLT